MPFNILLVSEQPDDGLVGELGVHDVRLAFRADVGSALAALAEQTYDVLVLDLPLAEWPEVTALTALRRIAPGVPVVVLTSDDRELARAALIEGAEDHLVRGHFDAAQLARCAWQAIARNRRRLDREAALSQAAQTERLATVGLLATGMAHEINNPLTYILGNLDLAQVKLRGARRPGRSPEEIAAAIDTVLPLLVTASQGAQRVRTVVRDLNTFGQVRTEAESAPVSARAAIDWVLAVAGPQVGPTAHVETDLRGPLHVRGDEARLGQVFLALLLNAADAFGDGAPDEHRIRIRARTHAGEVVVEVEDNGRGIPTDVIPHIFEPFFTTKEVGRGTGLGLYVARNLTNAMGGTIEIESAPAAGTTARVRLPAYAAPTRQQTAVAPAAARVLVLDDDALVLESLRTQLAETWEVVAVEDVRGAREQLARGGFDFLLCDLMMPDRSTIGFFEMLRARNDPLNHRFIFMTGGAFSPEARHFLRTIPNPCLTKPFGTGELAEAMETCRRLTGPARV